MFRDPRSGHAGFEWNTHQRHFRFTLQIPYLVISKCQVQQHTVTKILTTHHNGSLQSKPRSEQEFLYITSKIYYSRIFINFNIYFNIQLIFSMLQIFWTQRKAEWYVNQNCMVSNHFSSPPCRFSILSSYWIALCTSPGAWR